MKTLIKLLVSLSLSASGMAYGQDVELLEVPNQPTNEQDLVFTIVSGIKIEGKAWFYQQKKMVDQSLLLRPVAQWQQRFSQQYLGFLLASEKNDAGFKWSGNLKVYFGKLSDDNNGVTQPWPQSKIKDRSYQQTRAAARSFKRVELPGLNDTLRIYYAPNNTAWEPPSAEHPDGSYEKNDALVILYIDPQTGAKKRAIYSPSELYALRSKLSNPRDQSEVSIWYTVKAGAIDFSMLEEAGEERGIPVNLYTTQIFLFDDMDEGGYAYGAGDGDPIAEPVASGDDIKSLSLILDKAMGNDVDNSEVQAAVQDVVQLMRSI